MNANSSELPSSGNMSAGSSMMNPPEFMTRQKRRDLILAHLVFDVDGHSVTTQNRLHSAADFMLKDYFDGFVTPFDDEFQVQLHINGYLSDGKEGYKTFLAIKLITVNMIHLEDVIIRSQPDRDYDNLSDEALKTIIEEHIRQKEVEMLQNKNPMHPEGIELSKRTINDVLKTRSYENEPGTSIADDSRHCCICLEGFKKGNAVTSSNYCEHLFHDWCIMDWLSDHRLCPLCKQQMLPAAVGYPYWVSNLDLGKVRDFLKRVY